MIEMWCRLGGCCKGGWSKQQTGLQFLSLAAKALLKLGLCLDLLVETKLQPHLLY